MSRANLVGSNNGCTFPWAGCVTFGSSSGGAAMMALESACVVRCCGSEVVVLHLGRTRYDVLPRVTKGGK